MALDPYKPCVCGSGKKVKFCCSKDISGEIDEVLRMLEGEQRAAALDRLNSLITKSGERSALLALKANLLIQLGELDQARSVVGNFVVQQPENPVALGQSALLDAADGQLEKAVTALQRAIEVAEKEMPLSVYEALFVIGQALISHGNILAGRGHLLLHAALGRDSDTRAMQMLMRIHSTNDVPLLLKLDSKFSGCPEGVEQEQFQDAMKFANRGAWLAAVEKLEVLLQQTPGVPAILHNIAIMRNWLGDRDETIKAWRRYGMASGVELDDAVEAEALAQFLDPDSGKDKIDVLNVSYPVKDSEKLLELLASDKRLARMPVDPMEFATDDKPPPKGVYWLLDRPLPNTGEGIARDAVPLVLGELFLYGRQTDREPRLEFVTDKSANFENKTSELNNIIGELIGEPASEEVVDQVGMIASELTWNWRFPDDTPMDRRRDLIAEHTKDVFLNHWPELTLSVLNGKRPSEVAGDQAYRVRLLAAILLLELGTEMQRSSIDFNELRRKFNLPEREAIDPNEVDLSRLSLVRLPLVDPAKLSDDDLIKCYTRAGRLGATQALRHLAEEVVKRESLDEELDKIEAYGILARLTLDDQEAISHVHKSRDLAIADGNSPANWLLMELSIRLERGMPDEVPSLVEQIQARYLREPGVAQHLMDILVRFGLVSPDGTPAGPPPEEQPSVLVGGEQQSEPGKIWTPDGDTAAAGESETKSKLWVPD